MRLLDESGMMAIGVALMLTVVLALFGGALWQYSMAELKRVESTEQDLQALFLARAGAEMVMGVWMDPLQPRPAELPMKLDPIYYSSAAGKFVQTEEPPADCLGVIEVTVKIEEYPFEGKLMEATVIESVATVGSATRTARLMTYPHRYGHDLGWYSDQTGQIYQPTRSVPGELIVMRTDPPQTGIHIGENSPTGTIRFEARHLVFDSPLHLGNGSSNLRNSRSGTIDVALMAEVIFLDGLELVYLPGTISNPTKHYRIELGLPSGEDRGQLGSEIKDKIAAGSVVNNARYGEVYFGSGDTRAEYYYWFAIFEIGLIIHDYTSNLDLSNKGFYFRDGVKLDPKTIHAHIKNGGSIASYFTQLANTGLLVPILEDEQLNREDLENIQPFFWSQ